MKHILAINIDEIGANISEIAPFLRQNHLDAVELRTIDGKNFANFSQSEVSALRSELNSFGLTVCAIASPLFKWYKVRPETVQPYDSFNFPCILSDNEKTAAIERVMSNATQIGAPKVRVFSGLNGGEPNLNEVLTDSLFQRVVQIGAKNRVKVLIENEPVCHVFTLADIEKMLQKFPQLGLWLDVANLYQIGEYITLKQIRSLLPRTYHLHLKDLVIEEGNVRHVPLGEGEIPWEEILNCALVEASHQISFGVETHIVLDKIDAAEKSVAFFRKVALACGYY